MKKSVTIALSVFSIAALLLAGCTKSAPKTVESIIGSNEDVEEAIQSGASENSVEVEIKENTITYNYDLSAVEGITDEMLKDEEFIESLVSSLDSLTDSMTSVAATVEKQTGIEGVVIKVFYNYGGKEIANATFTSAGKVEENKEDA